MTERGHFGGGVDFAPDFGSKIGPFLGHFGQRQRVSGDLGASITCFKALNRPKINSTVPPGAIFGPWGPVWNPNFRVFWAKIGVQNLKFWVPGAPRGAKIGTWGYRRVDFWAIYGLKTHI